MRRLVIWLIFSVAAFGCTPGHSVTPDVATGGTTGLETCGDCCAHARELSCDVGKPTPEGAACEDVCQNVLTSGVVTIDLGCCVQATTCAQLDRCTR